LWTVARHLDQPAGSGKVEIQALKQYLKKMSVHPRTAARWTRKALDMGVFEQDLSGRFYRYKSPARTAVIFKAKTIMTSVVIHEPERLFSPGWIGVMWAGFIESLNRDRPISRAILEKVSGVPAPNQRYYEGLAGDMITVYPSMTVIGVMKEKDPEKRSELLQHLRRSQGDDSYRIINNMVVKQLPNVYGVKGVYLCKKGRSRKSRAILSDLLDQGQQVNDDPLMRLYYNSQRASEKAAKRYEHTTYYFIDHDRRGINWYGSTRGGGEYVH